MRIFKTSLKLFVLLTFLTGVVYPLFIMLIAKWSMPNQADGSILTHNGQIIGSKLIAQNFISEKYFWPRPSAHNYDGLASGGTNWGPTSKQLQEFVKMRVELLGKDAPTELVYNSASGLDPHVSKNGAYFQADRIAKARSISTDQVKEMIDAQIKEHKYSLLGRLYVNVLLLNQSLDEKYP